MIAKFLIKIRSRVFIDKVTVNCKRVHEKSFLVREDADIIHCNNLLQSNVDNCYWNKGS